MSAAVASAPSSQLQRTVERALRIALKHRVAVSAPGARRCHRCGRTGHDRRTCCAPELLVNAWALRRAALYERSARRDREHGRDREQRPIRDPRRLDPMAQPNSCSPRERTHLGCRCPGQDGTTVDVASIAAWIREGCVLHDTARGDARAAARAWDGLGVRAGGAS